MRRVYLDSEAFLRSLDEMAEGQAATRMLRRSRVQHVRGEGGDVVMVPYRSEDGSVVLEGRDWLTEPRTWRDVLRCRLGRHHKVMWGWVNLDYTERCSCGALSRGRDGWICLDRQAGRRG